MTRGRNRKSDSSQLTFGELAFSQEEQERISAVRKMIVEDTIHTPPGSCVILGIPYRMSPIGLSTRKRPIPFGK
jgi:hypothetical protein